MSETPGVSIDVKYEDDATRELAAMLARLGKLEPALEEIGASNVTETQMRFEAETDPTGNKWAKHSPVTTMLRKERGARTPKILRDTANLYDSLTYGVLSKTNLRVGVTRVYGRIHHLGGYAGRNKKVLIPARPYLGISKEGAEEIVQILSDHVRGVS